ASDLATLDRYQRSLPKDGRIVSLNMRELVDRALASDPLALQAVQKTAEYLGMGIALLANSLNPEAIILDGEIGRAWSLIEDRIWSVIRAKALASNVTELKVRPTTIPGNASLMGALSLVISRRFVLARNRKVTGAA
ncbi:MAG: ROK family protein, partial [Acidobacteria bacterium]|nr:ROK family protein [Acidobacteriota bacterium]